MQIDLFTEAETTTVSPAFAKLPVSRSACRKTWITVDGRTVFEAGRMYTHAKTAELAIKGENGIVMWMSDARYREHFCLRTGLAVCYGI